ncbi:MAG: adenylate kinase [bacterium]|jgi:adenylate kinase|nr:adenylate kinase [candidate division KSB1 bacterium]MDH7560128.1 adenylate kinase [bacterium]
MRLIILGAPGTGKGTQASLLANHLRVAHISTGDMLREAVAQRTPLGQKVEGIMAEGKLVPDRLMIAVVSERLRAADCQSGFILDGFPRTLAQAKALDRLLERQGKAIDLVLMLEVPDAEIVRRLSSRRVCAACGAVYNLATDEAARTGICPACGGQLVQRPDDREETVRERLRVYARQTLPLRRYYEQQGKLRVIPGDRSIPEVQQVVQEAVQRLSTTTTAR